jgi:hypothetical protein
MLSSNRLFLLLPLACETLFCASLVAGQNSNTQQLNNSNVAAPVLRRVVVRHLGSFDATMLEEVAARAGQVVYRPRVETPYDQTKLDSMQEVLQELRQERGVSVNVESKLTQIRDTRYAILEFVIYTR